MEVPGSKKANGSTGTNGSLITTGSNTLFQNLVVAGLLSHDQYQIGLIQSKRSGDSLDKTLLQLGFITETLLNKAIVEGEHNTGRKVRTISLTGSLPDPEALSLIPRDLARRFGVIPVSLRNRVLLLATTDLYDLPARDQLQSLIGGELSLELVLAGEREIAELSDRFYGFELSIDGILHEIETGEVVDDSDDRGTDYHQPVVRLVDAILSDAVKHRASDIHFEPEAGFIRIRYRVDGVMRQIRSFHSDYWAAIVVRIKVLAELNIAESRAPQDGQLSMNVSGGDIEFRVSCMPTLYGENVVLRVLDRQKGIVSIENLGLEAETLKQLDTSMNRPEGLILITGPTGSGKTTTLYSMLNHKSDESINIMTLEDPVEYPMALLRQTSVNEQIKLDFSSGIKSILRQDPDVILVGEIRDKSAAEMVFRASMTGHQVYSTLHTNSAVGAISRLRDLSVTSAVIGANVISIVGQRLVRKLCLSCRIAENSTENDFSSYQSSGCKECGWLGYHGRVAVMEVLRITPAMNELISSGASDNQLLETARLDGFTTLTDAAMRLVRSGITSMTEVSRVIDFTNFQMPRN